MYIDLLEKLLKYSITELFEDVKLKVLGFPYKCKFLGFREKNKLSIKESSLNFSMVTYDGKVAHFEFKKEYNYNDIYKFLMYSSILIYENKDDYELTVIYPKKIKKIIDSINFTSLRFMYNTVFLNDFNGDKILAKTKKRISSGKKINEYYYLNLALLPYMKSNKEKINLAIDALKVINKLQNKKKNSIMIILICLVETFLDESDVERLVKEVRMYKVGKILYEEGRKAGINESLQNMSSSTLNKGKHEAKIEVASEMIKFNEPIEKIIRYTGLDKYTIDSIYYNLRKLD